MAYVYSTLSNDHSYAVYKGDLDPKQINHPVKTITIKGGANVAGKTNLIAPKGVVTIVSKDDLEILKGLKSFQRHVKKKFIYFDEKKTDVDRVAKDMEPKDRSAQLTDDDFKQDKQPKVNKQSKGIEV